MNQFFKIPYLMFTYGKNFRAFITILIFICLLQNISYFFIPFLTKQLFDKAIALHNQHLLMTILLLLTVTIIIIILTTMINNYLSCKIGVLVANQLRKDIHMKVLELKTTDLAHFHKAALLSLFSNDITMVRFFVTQTFWYLINGVLFGCLGIGLLFYFNYFISSVVLALLIIVFLICFLVYKRASFYAPSKQAVDTDSLTYFNETLNLIAPIHILRLEKLRKKRFSWIISFFEKPNTKYWFFSLSTRTVVYLGIETVRIAIIALGSYLLFIHYITFGLFFSYLTLLTYTIYYFSSIASALPIFTQANEGINRIFDFLNFKTNFKKPVELKELPILSEKISFENVNFYYPHQTQPALCDLNLEILKNQSVAIVGISGSGKSTFLNLLLKETMPAHGKILWDQHDTDAYSTDSLLAQVGAVLQTSYLFHMSILDNIRMGKQNASMEEIIKAAQQAEIHETIIKLPQGYETLVGEDSVQLSIGQRQRIILAQAILTDPQLLILDEPTAALDPITQAGIQKTLLKLMQTRTVVLVTHHLKEAMNMDKIYVIDSGKIVESGSHEELLQLNGFYSELWQKQTGMLIEQQGIAPVVSSEWLKRIPLFSKLTPKYLEILAKQFSIATIAVGQSVINEGEVGYKFYIILKGKVRVSKKINGEIKTVAILENGDFFGEIALLEAIPRTAQITTLETSTFLILYQDQFKELLTQMPEDVRDNFLEIAKFRHAEAS